MKNVTLTLILIFMALTIFWLWNRNSELKEGLKNSTVFPLKNLFF